MCVPCRLIRPLEILIHYSTTQKIAPQTVEHMYKRTKRQKTAKTDKQGRIHEYVGVRREFGFIARKREPLVNDFIDDKWTWTKNEIRRSYFWEYLACVHRTLREFDMN